MFSTEDAMQAAVHHSPELVLSGIPEINPEFCPDMPGLLSLGREIPLSTGPIDNLFIDVNAVLTFVECKRYCDSRLKREVYPQALNYASDLQNILVHYNRSAFHEAFADLISSAQGGGYGSIEAVLGALAKDPILEGKNLTEWRRQFLERLEYNIKSGVCRVVLLCAPAPNNAFNYRAVRNLMQLMSFSEHSSSRYDLVLMDLREERDELISKIIWRRYAALPQIPLIAESIRDTSIGIDKMKEREASLPSESRVLLQQFLEALSEQGFMAVENTSGYALKSEDTKKSFYTKIEVGNQEWTIIRHQIGQTEALYSTLESEEPLPFLDDLNAAIKRKKSTLGTGQLFEISFSPKLAMSVGRIVKAVVKLAKIDENAT
ncbi:MAG: hypothetical protein CO187_07570 [Zetaproteobacteria bacterium CG_4_9_14_3_um_filter_53_7]|nr:MAG: hypothetical protein CO187_07570 [Zetaproteobacteria bacterium CG_4_9_14_3_um_filter_53_7]